MSPIIDDALVLTIYPYAESDGVVVFLTRNHGKVRLLVRGLRSLKRQQHGVISPFNRITLSFKPRGPDQLGYLAESGLQRGVDIAAGNLADYYFLSYMHEVVLGMEIDPVAGNRIFRLLDAMTESTLRSGFRIDRLCYFQFWLLRLEGLMPDPGTCGSCGCTFEQERAAMAVDVHALSFVCKSCRSDTWKGDIHAAQAMWVMLQGFLKANPDVLVYIPLDMGDYMELISHFNSKISGFIGKNSKSLPVLLGAVSA
jgi:DNA repair protein RecO